MANAIYAIDEFANDDLRLRIEWIDGIEHNANVRATLVEMIEKRVTDGGVLRLIWKWINVGVIEDSKLLVSETGTGQGQPISPVVRKNFCQAAVVGP